MKKILAVIAAVIIVFGMGGASRVTFADRYSPPDESIPETPPEQAESDAARADRERAAADRAARDAAARRARERAEAEARRQEEARRAEEAKRAEEEAERVAREEYATRLMQTGIDHVYEGRYQMAINVLRNYADNNPHSADAWYWISRAHHAMGDYERAQAAVGIALEIDPYYGPLTKTPSGLQPMPPLTRAQRKEPRPSMSIMPVKPPLPSELALEPVTMSFPYLVSGSSQSGQLPESQYTNDDAGEYPYLRYLPYPPMEPGRTSRWMASDEKFSEIGRWRFRVDRMGILTNPRVPIAWRGTRPYEVYFWTGKEWARIVQRGEGETFDSILLRELSGITEITAKEGPKWNELDTPALAASASLMRYMWVGDVDPAAMSRRARDDDGTSD